MWSQLPLHITNHSSSLWLEKIVKAHPFANPGLAKAQGRLEQETLYAINLLEILNKRRNKL